MGQEMWTSILAVLTLTSLLFGVFGRINIRADPVSLVDGSLRKKFTKPWLLVMIYYAYVRVVCIVRDFVSISL